MLVQMRLPDQLIKAIMNCVTSCTLNILWNGEPTGGIHQGDPLSSYLFVACMERLSQLIENNVAEGKWKAIPLFFNRMDKQLQRKD